MKQLAFLIISSTPSLKIIAQISSHSLLPYQLTFIVFRVSTSCEWHIARLVFKNVHHKNTSYGEIGN
jgi:hypothetical protein